MDEIEKSEQVKKLEEELKIATIKNQIDTENKKTRTNSIVGKILIGAFGIIAFIVVTFVSLQIFSSYGIDPKLSPIFSLLSGAFATYIILMASGIVKEFTIKGGTLELSTALQEDIKNVQNDVKETKKDISDKYERLIQHINTRIDTVFTSSVSNVNQFNIGDIVDSVSKLIREEKAEKLYDAGIRENMDANKDIILPKDLKHRIDTLNNLEERLNKILEKTTSKSPTSDNYTMLLEAGYFANKKEYDKSLSILNKIIENDHQNVKAWHNKGVIMTNLKRPDEALPFFEKALEFDPLHYVTWRNKGVTLRELGRFDEALLCFEKALELDPEYLLGWVSMAYTLEKLGRNEKAASCYEKALDKIPITARDYDAQGFSLIKLNRHTEALKLLEKALELDPNDAEIYYDLAICYVGLNDSDKSIKFLTKAINLDSSKKEHARKEPFFDTVNKLPEFVKLVT